MTQLQTLNYVSSRRIDRSQFMTIDEANGEDRFTATDFLPSRAHTMFEVQERPLYMELASNSYVRATHKALVRKMPETGDIKLLAVVNNTYRVVQSNELYLHVHDQIASAIPPHALQDVLIRDKVAGFGATTLREYIFPEIAQGTSENERVAFRIIVQNGFGSSALKIHVGAIDFFCTNGMVIGDKLSSYAKHTKGLRVADFTKVISEGIEQFWNHTATIQQLKEAPISMNDIRSGVIYDRLKEYLPSEALAKKIYVQFLREVTLRGNNFWALYSAFTVYSSYDEGAFATRETGNDHAATTLLNREQTTRSLLSDRNGLFAPALVN